VKGAQPNRRIQMRRAVKRIPASFQAGELRGSGRIAKLSQEGLFFCTTRLPSPGMQVRVTFEDAHGGKIEIDGTVRWNTAQLDASRSGFGMHIEGRTDSYLEFYERLLTR
jgi:hypothetical protein